MLKDHQDLKIKYRKQQKWEIYMYLFHRTQKLHFKTSSLMCCVFKLARNGSQIK